MERGVRGRAVEPLVRLRYFPRWLRLGYPRGTMGSVTREGCAAE